MVIVNWLVPEGKAKFWTVCPPVVWTGTPKRVTVTLNEQQPLSYGELICHPMVRAFGDKV